MNKKGIFATLLVVQLVFLVILTLFVVQNEKIEFEHNKEYQRLASYRIASTYEDVQEGYIYLIDKNANSQAMISYENFINNEFSKYYLIDINLNITNNYLIIKDKNLEITKEGSLI